MEWSLKSRRLVPPPFLSGQPLGEYTSNTRLHVGAESSRLALLVFENDKSILDVAGGTVPTIHVQVIFLDLVLVMDRFGLFAIHRQRFHAGRTVTRH